MTGAVQDRLAATLDRLVPDRTVTLGVAVSGGPDSLALLLLAHGARPGRVRAATVDHGLRAESAAEADLVAAICARHGIPHAILRGTLVPTASLQAAARAFRYALLDGWCADAALPVLLTGHHADDQAETVLMRLARGSGVGGLAGIRETLVRTGAGGYRYRVVRPLLAVRRQALHRLVDAAGIVAVDDPSNAAPRHDRTRFRALLGQQALLDPARLATAARNMADADAALGWAVERLCDRHVGGTPALRTLDPAGLPDELVRRIVRRLLHELEVQGARDAAPRPVADGPDLMRLIARVRAGATGTAGNVQVRGGPIWTFCPLPRTRRR